MSLDADRRFLLYSLGVLAAVPLTTAIAASWHAGRVGGRDPASSSIRRTRLHPSA